MTTAANKTVTITTSDLNVTIVANDEGMFDLNDVKREAGLPDTKFPSEWRGKQKDFLIRTANLRVEKVGLQNYTWATEQGFYAYAMWVSMEFYLAVVEAFTALVNGDTEQAEEIAKSVVDVHGVTLSKRPTKSIRAYLEDFDDVGTATSNFIKDMANNKKASYEDRIRTLKSLRYVVDASYDDLNPRDRIAANHHDIALKLIAEEERRQARIHSDKKH